VLNNHFLKYNLLLKNQQLQTFGAATYEQKYRIKVALWYDYDMSRYFI